MLAGGKWKVGLGQERSNGNRELGLDFLSPWDTGAGTPEEEKNPDVGWGREAFW